MEILVKTFQTIMGDSDKETAVTEAIQAILDDGYKILSSNAVSNGSLVYHTLCLGKTKTDEE